MKNIEKKLTEKTGKSYHVGKLHPSVHRWDHRSRGRPNLQLQNIMILHHQAEHNTGNVKEEQKWKILKSKYYFIFEDMKVNLANKKNTAPTKAHNVISRKRFIKIYYLS